MKPKLNNQAQPAPDVEREVEHGAAMSSPFVVEVLDFFEDKTFHYIVMEYCTDGTFRDWMVEKTKHTKVMSESVCFSILNLPFDLIFAFNPFIIDKCSESSEYWLR